MDGEVRVLPSDPAVRTYKRRSGRVTAAQVEALTRWWPRYGIRVDGRPLDLRQLFGRSAPVVLDIGFGMGSATAELAAAHPDWDLLAVDVHTPGHGNLLRLLHGAGLANVRVADGDARVLLRDMLPGRCLSRVLLFFPDPWPKARHAKRRLVSGPFLDLLAERLVDGGLVHLATDDPAYLRRVRDLVEAHPHFDLVPTVPVRPATKYEERARREGRSSADLVARYGAEPTGSRSSSSAQTTLP